MADEKTYYTVKVTLSRSQRLVKVITVKADSETQATNLANNIARHSADNGLYEDEPAINGRWRLDDATKPECVDQAWATTIF